MRGIALTVALLSLVACGPEEVGSSGFEGGPGGPSEWLLVDGVPTVEGYPITLRLEDGRVGGVAACNNYGGDAVVADGRFEVGDLVVTGMGCPEPGVHDSEAAYAETLLAVERYEFQDGQLVLLGPDTELRFDPVQPPEDAALTGTDWQLNSLVMGDGPEAVVSSTMAHGWLRLDDDGTFSAHDGCNELAGGWSLEGDELHLVDVTTTDIGCPDLDQQTNHVVDVLTGQPAVEIGGRRLQLTAIELGLEYRAD